MQEKKREKSPIKQRILLFLSKSGISQYDFYRKTGITRGILGQDTGISEDNISRFLAYYTNVSTEWLLTGRGPMLRDISEPKEPVEKQSYVDDGLKNDTVTVAQLLEIVNKQVDIIKEQNREISRLRNRMSLVNSGIGIVGGGNLQNPPTPMPSQCGSAVENLSLEIENPAQISVEKCSRK